MNKKPKQFPATVTFRMSEDQKTFLTRYCDHCNTRRSEFIRERMKDVLTNLKPVMS